MPRAYPPEFRRRAVELARLREKPIARIAADLGDRRVVPAPLAAAGRCRRGPQRGPDEPSATWRDVILRSREYSDTNPGVIPSII